MMEVLIYQVILLPDTVKCENYLDQRKICWEWNPDILLPAKEDFND